jgi:hypothetical protein
MTGKKVKNWVALNGGERGLFRPFLGLTLRAHSVRPNLFQTDLSNPLIGFKSLNSYLAKRAKYALFAK